MKRPPSRVPFQRKLTWAFLVVGVIPLLVCMTLMLNVFRLSLDGSDKSNAESQLTALGDSFSSLLSSCGTVLEELRDRKSVV